MEAEQEANLSDLQVNGNTQVNLGETEFEADSQEPPTPGVAAPDAPSASVAPSSSSARQRNKRKRASTSEEIVDTLVESINEIKTAYQQQSSILVDIVSCFKHEKEGAERKMKLMALLRNVPGLSVEERVKVALKIAKDNHLIDMVFQLQSEDMLPFLKTLL
ncbi:hypothetical protein PIB30_000019 [Stylosanthes scabra]|uniref:Uncharacterized protein n=1 Tax=Stylosanthes scabra TaxID=79078 RepID=A0ABU6Q1U5_9FABA|nr:hypothetical protein [Stylosanthes scabra]